MGKPAKSQIETIPQALLTAEAKEALIRFKNSIRLGIRLDPFENRNDELPRLDNGCIYLKVDIGAAHPGDDQPRGQRRLIGSIVQKSQEIREIYVTRSHYQKGNFLRVIMS